MPGGFSLSIGTICYTLHGKNIVHMTQGGNNLHFFYDASNKPAIVEFNGTKYAYVHNLQGDIVAILDSNGTAVVQYKYDAWGKPISKMGSMAGTLGTVQPFRYRGYVYDEETGLYYLRSRYFNSASCRFINADSILGAVGSLSNRNAYVYCDNVITSLHDPDGNLTGDASTASRPKYTLGNLAGVGGGAVLLVAASDSVFDTLQGWAESIKQAWNTLWGISSAITVATVLTAEEAIAQSLQYNSFLDELKNAKANGDANQKKPNCPLNMHHIIAQTDPAALIAREIWVDECHLSIHHPDNLVAVSTKMHWYMHTPAYFASVNSIVVFASALPGNEKENVRTAIRLVALAITTVDCGLQ